MSEHLSTRLTATLIALIAFGVVGAGCTVALESDRAEDVSPAARADSGATPVPLPTAAPQDGPTTLALDWTVDETDAYGSFPVAGPDGAWFLKRDTTVVRVDASGTETTVYTVPNDDWLVDELLVTDDAVALRSHDESSSDYPTEMVAWQHQDPSAITTLTGTELYMALSGTRLLTTEFDGQDSCLVERDLGAGATPHTLVCGGYMQWPTLTAAGAAWRENTGTSDNPCPTVRALPRGAARPVDVSAPCMGFQGVVAGDWLVWFEAEVGSSQLSWSDTLARPVAGGDVVALSEGSAGSLTVCDTRAVWIRHPNGEGQVTEQRSFDPTARAVVVLYAAAPPYESLTSPTCSGDDLSFKQNRTDGKAGAQRLRAQFPEPE